ncbi:MAG: MFS transporter, partial [Vulcanimicrobiaceae bacterium]
IESAWGVPTVLALMAGVSLLGLLSTWAFGIYGHGLTLEQHQTQILPRRRPKAALLASPTEGRT